MKAIDAFISVKEERPTWSDQSLPITFPKLQRGGLSLTRRDFSALVCSFSTDARAVWTRVCSSDNRVWRVKTLARTDSTILRVNPMESVVL